MTKQEHFQNFISMVKRGNDAIEPRGNRRVWFDPGSGWSFADPQTGIEEITRETALALLDQWAETMAARDARIAADAAHLASL